MKLYFFVVCIFFLAQFRSTLSGDEALEEVNEEELKQLTKDEKYVLVLFMKEPHCHGECHIMEKHLLAIREELAEALGAWVIRCHAPDKLVRLGGSPTTDMVVTFRLGQPMLYTGTLEDEEEMLNFFIINKESNLRKLTDDSFEHETQASTGATTGDWLVLFTKESCERCDRVLPQVEAVAAILRGRKNVATVLREDNAGVTTRRFGVTEFPTAILFRLGRLYRYPHTHSSMTASDLVAFADDTFRNARAEEIPKPKTPFDDVTQAIADWLRENPYQFLAGVGGCFVIVLVLVLLNSPPPSSWTKQSKKKKKTQ